MTPAALRSLLRRESEKAGSQKAWADLHGLSLPYVNDVLNGRKDPGPSILSALGLEKIVEYRKVKS